MKTRHNLLCESSVCNDDPNPRYRDEVIYQPGDRVCKKKPEQKFQRVQHRINESYKRGGFQETDGFTANQLENSPY